jgi:hypothetical protein
VSRSAASASSSGIPAKTALGEYRAIFGRGIHAVIGSAGGNEALAEEEVEVNDEKNGGDFFRQIVSFSAFL